MHAEKGSPGRGLTGTQPEKGFLRTPSLSVPQTFHPGSYVRDPGQVVFTFECI